MAINKIEHLEDRIRVHYHLDKAYAVRDVDGSVEVPYDEIHKLKIFDKNKEFGLGLNIPVEIHVPKCNKTLVFVFDSYMETSKGPNEEDIYGPFLKIEDELEKFIKQEAKKRAPQESIPILSPKNYKLEYLLKEVVSNVRAITSNPKEAEKALDLIFNKVTHDTSFTGDGYHSHSFWSEQTNGVYLEEAITLAGSNKKLLELMSQNPKP